MKKQDVNDKVLHSIQQVVMQLKSTKKRQHDNPLIYNAVRDAILLEQIDSLRYLLNEGLDWHGFAYEQKQTGNPRWLSYLHFAVLSGNLSIVQLFVEAGANFAKENKFAIREAIEQNNTEISLYLFEHGAKCWSDDNFDDIKLINQFDTLRPLLPIAAANGNHTLVNALLQRGASLHSAINTAYRKYAEFEYAYHENLSNQPKLNAYYVKKIAKAESWEKTQYSKELESSEKKSLALANSYQQARACYLQTLRTLLDHAVGHDFKSLRFLEGQDVSGFNFIGLSLNGEPITAKLLSTLNVIGIDDALFYRSDLAKLNADPSRQKALTKRIQDKIAERGLIVLDGTLNLVPLWRAAANGDENTVCVRLSARVNPNEMCSDDYHKAPAHPLIAAAKNGYFSIVQLCAEHPDIDTTIFVKAITVAHRFPEIVSYLEDKQSINAQDKEGNTRMHHASLKGDVALVKKLLNNGANVSITNKSGETPLELAIQHSENHQQIVALLLKHSPDIKNYSYTLQLAFKRQALGIMGLLLSTMDIKPNIVHSYYEDHSKRIVTTDPWYSNLIFDSLELIYHAWDHEERNQGFTVLKMLKQYGADFNLPHHYDGDTILHKTIRFLPSHKELSNINFFIFQKHEEERKQTVESTNNRLQNVLMIVDFLLANGADPSLTNKKGFTPLHILLQEINLSYLERPNNDEKRLEQLLSKQTYIHTNVAGDEIALDQLTTEIVTPQYSLHAQALQRSGSPLFQNNNNRRDTIDYNDLRLESW
ncbi:MAG: ankyrin repeat domain-containing protein [Tatlockia sp.]|jgi:ankyrin repeat protein